MTKQKRDEIRATKRHLQAERVAWKKANPGDAAVKDYLNAVASEHLAGVRAGRLAHRADKIAMKRVAREKRIAAKLAMRQAKGETLSKLKMDIANARRNPPVGVKTQRGFFSNLKAKWLRFSRQGG